MITALRVCAPAHFVLFKEFQQFLRAHYYLQKKQLTYIIWKTPNRTNSQGRISIYIDWFFNFWAKEIHCAQQKNRASDKRTLLLSKLSLTECLQSSFVLSDSTAGLHLSVKQLCYKQNQGCLTFWFLYCISDPSVSFLTVVPAVLQNLQLKSHGSSLSPA